MGSDLVITAGSATIQKGVVIKSRNTLVVNHLMTSVLGQQLKLPFTIGSVALWLSVRPENGRSAVRAPAESYQRL